MHSSHINAPTPDLRIVMVETLHAHEEHDSQRSQPLIERLRNEKVVINPPVVAAMGASQFVILDGANRCYSFSDLGYSHLLVQVASYDAGYVDLDTWNHVVSGWNKTEFITQLKAIPGTMLSTGQDAHAIAHILFSDGEIVAVHAPVENTHERNATLRQVVALYQQNAILNRTALKEPEEIWPLYPDALCMVVFPRYQPADIIAAAKFKAYLPPGISRHIVHGRALRVNYPLDLLYDSTVSLRDKNEALREWLQDKLAKRHVRYYAEAIYQFDE